jgi:hypothetical protein
MPLSISTLKVAGIQARWACMLLRCIRPVISHAVASRAPREAAVSGVPCSVKVFAFTTVHSVIAALHSGALIYRWPNIALQPTAFGGG